MYKENLNFSRRNFVKKSLLILGGVGALSVSGSLIAKSLIKQKNYAKDDLSLYLHSNNTFEIERLDKSISELKFAKHCNYNSMGFANVETKTKSNFCITI